MTATLIVCLVANIICAVYNVAFGNWIIAALNVFAAMMCAYSLGTRS